MDFAAIFSSPLDDYFSRIGGVQVVFISKRVVLAQFKRIIFADGYNKFRANRIPDIGRVGNISDNHIFGERHNRCKLLACDVNNLLFVERTAIHVAVFVLERFALGDVVGA